MLNLSNTPVLLYVLPVDMRKSIDGLSALVSGELKLNPTDNYLFVFRNKASNKIKILYWERNGFWLFYKRLEKSRFCFPGSGERWDLSITQLRWLLDGLDIGKLKEQTALKYKSFY